MPNFETLTSVAEYALLMRVPILTGAILILLPLIARTSPFRSVLRGVFDVTPASMISVTLAATSAAGIVVDNARVIYMHSYDRHVGGLPGEPAPQRWLFWVFITLVLSLPVITASIWFSDKQNSGDLVRRISYSAVTLAGQVLLQGGLLLLFRRMAVRYQWDHYSAWPGYTPLNDHITAGAGFTFALFAYSGTGFYGYFRLGKKRTVPALCSALMVMIIVCSLLSALSFLLDVWHIPLLLVLLLAGMITSQSRHSDHFYDLVKRTTQAEPPTPLEALLATRPELNGRVILVAANGGGIQAAAWAAQVLEGLGGDSPRFAPALRLISSVSGGSLGSACYVYKQANEDARKAADAASISSLDEVSWGLSWPDLINSLFPWFTKKFIGRGRALEKAWCANCDRPYEPIGLLDSPLSNWNERVRSGELPAVILNATIVETGQRLLFATTKFNESLNGCARVDARQLHGEAHDVAVVTAARLSASFPYVTPAARSTLPGPRVHVVDGGYYDNYGMATLVEWLDEALRENAGEVKSVLVIQLHGAPVAKNDQAPVSTGKDRGWFFQILAPLLTLGNVRSAGQISHNDLELTLLQQKWNGVVPIHSVTMEFPDDNTPLSWHLTRLEQDSIVDVWVKDPKVRLARQQVSQFLAGQDNINCHCPTCKPRPPLKKAATG